MKKEWVSGTPKLIDLRGMAFPLCAGCGHPLVARLICEAVEELGIGGRAIGVAGVGCSVNIVMMVGTDSMGTPHGRPPDAATGIKRLLPEAVVFTAQGDGDCISIGAGSLFGAVARSEKITVIMANNGNYGTTGGQLAPTTPMGEVTTTTPSGRTPAFGYPVHVAEVLVPWKGVAYSARGAVNSPASYQRTRGYLKTAFQKQMDNVGFSFVEILTPCPPNFHLSPLQSLSWVEEKMVAEFPLGEFKNVDSIE